ncbi:MAG: sulfotransferase family protein [Cyanobacteria bacterium P01_F01_bin.150]
MSKIFCIGLSKTGTSSLNSALEHLGFKAKHFPFMSYRKGNLVLNPEHVDNYDAFSDTPVANCFKYLDKKYPNSKFIYTVRDKEAWLKSCEKHYAISPLNLSLIYKQFKWVHLQYSLYGCLNFNKEKFSGAYSRHDNNVLEYFDTSSRLLVLNICDGEGWDKLCPFLNKSIPDISFPKSNITAAKIKYI